MSSPHICTAVQGHHRPHCTTAVIHSLLRWLCSYQAGNPGLVNIQPGQCCAEGSAGLGWLAGSSFHIDWLPLWAAGLHWASSTSPAELSCTGTWATTHWHYEAMTWLMLGPDLKFPINPMTRPLNHFWWYWQGYKTFNSKIKNHLQWTYIQDIWYSE